MAKTLIFNWKLNPATQKQAEALLGVYQKTVSKNCEIVISPPFEHLWFLNAKKPVLGLGFCAQDCFWENLGPYTGAVSALNLKLSGIDYVILGHSEKRIHLGETDAMVNKKILNAIGSGLKPVVCFGEDLKTHAKGEDVVKKFIKKQLTGALKGLNSYSLSQKNSIIVAYELVWAISNNSGNVADSPADAAKIIEFIKDLLVSNFGFQVPRVLYGGSVNRKNIKSFLSFDQINGFLVGRASLDREEIQTIVRECGAKP